MSQEREGNILMKGILIKKINDNFDRALDTSLPEPDVAENQILVEVHYGGLRISITGWDRIFWDCGKVWF